MHFGGLRHPRLVGASAIGQFRAWVPTNATGWTSTQPGDDSGRFLIHAWVQACSCELSCQGLHNSNKCLTQMRADATSGMWSSQSERIPNVLCPHQ